MDPLGKQLRIIGRTDCPDTLETAVRCAVVSLQTTEIDMADAAFQLDHTYGIMTRVGLHCAPSAHRTLGTYPQGTIRFSFGPENTLEEINTALKALGEITGVC